MLMVYAIPGGVHWTEETQSLATEQAESSVEMLVKMNSRRLTSLRKEGTMAGEGSKATCASTKIFVIHVSLVNNIPV